MRASVVTALFVTALLSGCMAGEPDPPIDNSPAPSFPHRTDKADKPVYMVHGFNIKATADSGSSDPANWNLAKQVLRDEGFTGPLRTVGYYACDAGFDVHISNYGAHTGPHESGECGTQVHTIDTPIEHLAQHLAWMLYTEHASNWDCVDVIAHSMGGLVTRMALAGVDDGLPGYPPELCVEDAVTLGTPHGGAGHLGSICALASITQCVQMTDPTFLQALATKWAYPEGSHRTDWTTIASEADAVVGFQSATNMPAYSVIFLGPDVSHSGGSSYQEIDQGSQYRARFDAGMAFVMSAAPGPLIWTAEALQHEAFLFANGLRPKDPEAIKISPTSQPMIVPGQSVEFEGGCANERSDLKGGQWWTRPSGGMWHGESFDSVQLDATPWIKATTFTFSDEGDFEVKFTCLNDSLSEDSVTWSVNVDVANNDIPTANRVNPPGGAGSYDADTIVLEGSCANPFHDLTHADWLYTAPESNPVVLARDTVQWHADPWLTEQTVEFPNDGTYEVTLRCVDELGATDETTWIITVTLPPGPDAYRYYPSQDAFSINQGDSVEFEAGCSNPDGDLNRGEWWINEGSGWYMENSDSVQWNSDPWEKTRQYTFPNQGQVDVQFRCINDDGGTGAVTWAVQVF